MSKSGFVVRVSSVWAWCCVGLGWARLDGLVWVLWAGLVFGGNITDLPKGLVYRVSLEAP